MAVGLPVAGTETSDLIRLMTGRTIENVFPAAVTIPADAAELLVVEHLGAEGVFEDVSFTVRAGEIVGLAGLVGSGRSEILETIYGARTSTSGSVTAGGVRLRPGSVGHAVSHGLGLSPEERKSQGLLLDQAVFRNVTLSSFVRFAWLSFLNERAERSAARSQLDALDLRPANPDQPAGTLSGGNQQKVMLARWLVHGTSVLLLDEPTRGVDVGARAEIYTLIRSLAAAGTAIVIVSSEIEEVLGLANRVLVIGDGRVIDSRDSGSIDEQEVLDLVMKGNAA